MSSRICTLATTVALVGTVSLASAQTQLTTSQIAVACAPPPLIVFSPSDSPRITGSQDTVPRSVYGLPELLVINAGTSRGIQVNQQYFVRRQFRTAETHTDKLAHPLITAGWVHIVAANANMALASPDHVCSDFQQGDWLEPFAAPELPSGNIFTAVADGELDFKNYTRVLFGPQEKWSAGTGEFVMIDHGADWNITVGSHYGIWRDLQLIETPLTQLGEATAVSVGPSMALLLVTKARDAVFKGDIVVPRVADASATPDYRAQEAAKDKADRERQSFSRPSSCLSGGRVPPQSRQCGD